MTRLPVLSMALEALETKFRREIVGDFALERANSARAIKVQREGRITRFWRRLAAFKLLEYAREGRLAESCGRHALWATGPGAERASQSPIGVKRVCTE